MLLNVLTTYYIMILSKVMPKGNKPWAFSIATTQRVLTEFTSFLSWREVHYCVSGLRWEPMSQHVEGFAHKFYKSSAWKKCMKSYRNSKGGLCERCWSKGLIVQGEEVHHKIRLTPENIDDPSIALNWDNLELLCKACHLEEHRRTRWRTDELGHVEL